MTRYQQLSDEFIDSQPQEHLLVRRRVFRFVCMELPAYQADLENMTTEQAKERLKDRVLERCKAGFGFVIPVAILTVIIIAAIEWAVWQGLDALLEWWRKRHPKGTLREAVSALATEAESCKELESEQDE